MLEYDADNNSAGRKRKSTGGDVKAVSESGTQTEKNSDSENNSEENNSENNSEENNSGENNSEENNSENNSEENNSENNSGENNSENNSGENNSENNSENNGQEENKQPDGEEIENNSQNNVQKENKQPVEEVKADTFAAMDNVQNQAAVTSTITLDKDSETVVAGNSTTFTVTYNGTGTITGLNAALTNADGSYSNNLSVNTDGTITVATTEDMTVGEYTLTVTDGNNLSATATVSITKSVAKIEEKDGTTTYYSSVKNLFANQISGGSKVTVFKSTMIVSSVEINTDDEGIELYLNQSITTTINKCLIINTGKVTLNSFNETNLCLKVNAGGTLINNAYYGNIRIFSTRGNVILKNGTIVMPNVDDNIKNMSELLAEGYAYQNYYDGTWISYEEVSQKTNNNEGYYNVVQCDHNDVADGRCKYCNEKFVASVTSGSTTNYYADIDSALSAVNNASDKITILDNITTSVVHISNPCRVDLNGKNINDLQVAVSSGNVNISNSSDTQSQVGVLSVAGISCKLGKNIGIGQITNQQYTIGTMLADDTAFKVGDSYATDKQLASKNLSGSITTVEVPFKILSESDSSVTYDIPYGYNKGTKELYVTFQKTRTCNLEVKYSIDGGDERIAWTSSGANFSPFKAYFDDAICRKNDLSVGTHTFTYTVETDDGYKVAGSTYNFNIVKSETSITAKAENTNVPYSDLITIKGTVKSNNAPASTNSISTYSIDDTPKTSYVSVMYNGKEVGTAEITLPQTSSSGSTPSYSYYYYYTVYVKASDIGTGEKTFTVKYIGDDRLADAETTVTVNVEKSTPSINNWGGFPYGNQYTGLPIDNPTAGDGLQVTNSKTNSFSDINEFKWYTAAKDSSENYTKTSETPLAENPTNAGDYIVEAVFKETETTNATTCSQGITIGKMQQSPLGDTQSTIEVPVTVYIDKNERTYEIDLNSEAVKTVIENKGVNGVLENDTFAVNNTYGGINSGSSFVDSATLENGKIIIKLKSLSGVTAPSTVGSVITTLTTTNYNVLPLTFSLNARNKAVFNNLDVTMEGWTYGDTATAPAYAAPEGTTETTVTYTKADDTPLAGLPTNSTYDAGDYKVTVKCETGDAIYTGTATFTVTPKNMTDNATIDNIADRTYKGGKAIMPELTVKDGDTTLVKGTDYEVVYSDNTNVGQATATVTFKGNYAGTATKKFNIVPRDITNTTSTTTAITLDQDSFVYDGTDKKPEITRITVGDAVINGVIIRTMYLTANDYTADITANKDTGEYTITVEGKGNFKGIATKTWTITPKEVTNATVEVTGNYTYTGSDIMPTKVVVKDGDTEIPASEYTLSYEDNVNAGTATVTVTDKEGGNYTISGSGEFTINPKDIAGAEITLNNGSFVYDGTDKAPEITSIVVGGITLSANDYTSDITSKKDTGEYTITVEGKGNFTGTATKKWTITPKEVANANVVVTGEYTYTGSDITPTTVVVKDGDTEIPESEYTLSYENNVNAGTATVKVTDNAGGNYIVSGSGNFIINSKDISTTAAIENIASTTYIGSAIEPTVVVKDGDKTLVQDTDYTVAYSNNTNAGEATATVTFKGNYSGTATKIWTITPKEVTIKALNKSIRRGNVAPDLSNPVAGTDYEVIGLLGDDILGGTVTLRYSENLDTSNVGTADIIPTVTGINGNYMAVYQNGTLSITKRPSSGGGAESDSVSYPVTTPSVDNGKVTMDKPNAAEGTTITITAKPSEGYVVDKIKVTDKNGKEIKLTDNGNGTYTFTMPASKVEVKTTFKEAEKTPETENPSKEEATEIVVKMQINSKRLLVNGVAFEKDAAPVIRNNRTLVPIRFITESLGGEVAWNAGSKEVTLTIDGKEIKMIIGKKLEKYGVAPVIINGRTFVPVRFVTDELGAAVTWDDTIKTVTITKTVTKQK